VASNSAAVQQVSSYTICSRVFRADRCHKLACAATTVALVALSFYAPVTFTLYSLIASGFYIVEFNEAARTWDRSSLKNIQHWMIVACFISSGLMTALAIRTLPSCLSMVHHLRTLQIDKAVHSLLTTAATIGYLLPAIKLTAERGLELLKTARWTQMETYMSQDSSIKERVSSRYEKIGFWLAVSMPDGIENIPFLTHKMKGLISPFYNRYSVELRLRELLKEIEENINLSNDQGVRDGWTEFFIFLPRIDLETQIKLLPDIFRIGSNRQQIIARLPQELQKHFTSKAIELSEGYTSDATPLNEYIRSFESLKKRVEAIKDPIQETEELKSIGEAYTKLSIEAIAYSQELALYCPELDCKVLIDFRRTLEGSQQEIEKLNATKDANQEKIDLQDATWNYFIVEMGEAAYQKLMRTCGINNQEALDKMLDEQQIGTIGDFIDRVLDGKLELLKSKNVDAILKSLSDYLGKQRNDSRLGMYTKLVGNVSHHGNRLAMLVGRVVYVGVMALTAVAPIIVFPRLFSLGLTISMLALIPIVRNIVYRCFKCIVESCFRRVQRFMHRQALEYIGMHRVAARRPFFNILSSQVTPEQRLYQHADIFGKMRILSGELFYGWILLIASFDGLGFFEGVGGVIQGINVGTETMSLATQRWRRFRRLRA